MIFRSKNNNFKGLKDKITRSMPKSLPFAKLLLPIGFIIALAGYFFSMLYQANKSLKNLAKKKTKKTKK